MQMRLTENDAILMLESCDAFVQYFRFVGNHGNPIFGGGEKLTLMYSMFDNERNHGMFPVKRLKIIDSFFDEKGLKPHDIFMKSTENCWALGKTVEEKSSAMAELRIERPQQSNDYSVRFVYGVAVALAGMVISYFLIAKGLGTTKKQKLPSALYLS